MREARHHVVEIESKEYALLGTKKARCCSGQNYRFLLDIPIIAAMPPVGKRTGACGACPRAHLDRSALFGQQGIVREIAVEPLARRTDGHSLHQEFSADEAALP